jgi:hypothetical protein
MSTTRRKVKCGGCGRKITQSAPKSRDLAGKSWHGGCLVDSITEQLERRIASERAAGQ